MWGASRTNVVTLLLSAGVLLAVVFGLARGVESSNLHNGILAIACTAVGVAVLRWQASHREGFLFMATGVVEAVMFLGPQIGLTSTDPAHRWWGWLGVWLLPVSVLSVTLAIICFPDGRLPAPQWRPVVAAAVAVTVVSAALAWIWPVAYSDTGVHTPHPFTTHVPPLVAWVWRVVVQTSWVVMQVLWVVVVVFRWSTSRGIVRRQLLWMGASALMAAGALLVGLLGWRTPAPGVLAVSLMPVAAGWAMIHGQHLATEAALGWAARGEGVESVGDGFARGVAEAMGASQAVLWAAEGPTLHAVGTWPRQAAALPPVTEDELRDKGNSEVREVNRRGHPTGVISFSRNSAGALSLPEEQLLKGLLSQAALVLDHLDLAEVAARDQPAEPAVPVPPPSRRLTPREREVLELMALGRSNAQICEDLHLSIKTIEPVVSSIYAKLDLPSDAATNRRVLAVVAYLQERS